MKIIALLLSIFLFLVLYKIICKFFPDIAVRGYSKDLFFEILSTFKKIISENELCFSRIKINYLQHKTPREDFFHIIVHGGEANSRVYKKFKKELDSLPEKINIAFFVGPQLAVEKEKAEQLDPDGKAKCEDSKFWKLHPLLEMAKEKNNIKLFYKTDGTFSNENHFVYNDKAIYVEALHAPLREGEATIIKNPNYFVKRVYKNKIKILEQGLENGKIVYIDPSDTRTAKATMRFSTFQ